jgi:hypothetical protein
MKKNLLKIILYIALPSSILYFIWFLGVIYIGSNPFYSFAQRLIILPQALVSLAAVWLFRKWNQEPIYSFGQGLGVGLLVTIITAIISSTLIFIYCQYFEAQIVTEHIAIIKEYLIANKEKLIEESSEAVYNGNFANAELIDASSLAIDDFIWKLVRGAMFTILSSLALRRQASYT